MPDSDFVGIFIGMVIIGMILADLIRAIRNWNNDNSEWIILPDENNDDIIKSYTYICNNCHMIIKDKNYKHCPGCGRFMCNYKGEE